MNNYVVRNGEPELVYVYRIIQHGFNSYLFCRGTGSEVAAYVESEFPEAGKKSWHHALSDNEVDMVKKLGFTIYLAPKIREDSWR